MAITITQIKPSPHTFVETPQCCASVDPAGATKDYRQNRIRIAGRKGFKGNQCQRYSSYMIDDNPYCRSHAGKIALDVLMRAPGELEPSIKHELAVIEGYMPTDVKYAGTIHASWYYETIKRLVSLIRNGKTNASQ